MHYSSLLAVDLSPDDRLLALASNSHCGGGTQGEGGRCGSCCEENRLWRSALGASPTPSDQCMASRGGGACASGRAGLSFCGWRRDPLPGPAS
jgi:hypothetical protein